MGWNPHHGWRDAILKIGKALAEKKAAQNALARLIAERSRNFYHDKGRKPEVAFADLDRQIQRQMTKIRDLKLRIMSTNVSTILENGITLQEAIVRLGDVRSELHSHNQLLELQPHDRGSWFGSDRSPQERLPQIARPVLLDRIETLEAQKYHLDALIATANNTVDLGHGEGASPVRRR